MKTKDVVVGQCYRTRIGSSLVRVRVTDRTHPVYHWVRGRLSRQPVQRFIVQRVDNGRTLPKARVAAALHKAPAAPSPA